jgi:hypothetical protein
VTTEEAIAAVIRDVAGIDVRSDRTFFESGLTSELMLAVHGPLCREVGEEFPISSFYEFPTPVELAACLTRPVRQPGPPPRRPADRRQLRAWIADRAADRRDFPG